LFIHIGNNHTISDSKCIGIFNIESLKTNPDNNWLLAGIKEDDKLVVVDEKNNVITTGVSPFTIIKRTSISNDEIIWSRKNN